MARRKRRKRGRRGRRKRRKRRRVGRVAFVNGQALGGGLGADVGERALLNYPSF